MTTTAHDLSEVIESFRGSVADAVAAHFPTAQARAVLDGAEPPAGTWRRLCDRLGLQGLLVPESFGGSAAPVAVAAVAATELGRTLAPTPFLPTSVAAAALSTVPVDAARSALAALASQGLTATIAVAGRPDDGPGASPAPDETGMTATIETVLDGATADLLLLVSREAGDEVLRLVDLRQEAVTAHPLTVLDPTRPVARLTMTDAEASELARGPAAARPIDTARHTLMLLSAAESLGSAAACLDMALAYAHQRRAFGRAIGQFQAVKHLLADLALEIEKTRCAVDHAITGPPSDVELQITAAHAFDTALRAAADNIHVHGGIGFAWEHDAQLFLRRARANQALLGHPARLTERVADHYLGSRPGTPSEDGLILQLDRRAST